MHLAGLLFGQSSNTLQVRCQPGVCTQEGTITASKLKAVRRVCKLLHVMSPHGSVSLPLRCVAALGMRPSLLISLLSTS